MATYATPPRPGPGGYINTPAPRNNFALAPSFSNSTNPHRMQNLVPSSSAQPSTASQPAMRTAENLTATERAARAINYAQQQVTISGGSLEGTNQIRLAVNYSIHSSPTFMPFQKVRQYQIPDAIFEQLNRSQVTTNMGLFAELHHAWVSVDNAVYLWDYTQNNPELLGFEDLTQSIVEVQLAKPKPGVFLESIKHMIVVATTDQVAILGLGSDVSSPGTGLSLFQTGMSASVRGLAIENIACSEKTGRIFLGNQTDSDVRELKYQAQDSWFASRCYLVNHTSTKLDTLTVALSSWRSTDQEYVKQMVIDDTRNLLYTLSSKSTIRAYYISTDGSSLEYKAQITMQTICRGIDYNLQQVITDKSAIVSISAIGEQETQAWVLMAVTERGYRIYLSGSFYGSSTTKVLNSLAPAHARTPPLKAFHEGQEVSLSPQQPSDYLRYTRTAVRLPPGYFLCAVERSEGAAMNRIFASVPDFHSDSSYPQSQGGSLEIGSWIELDSQNRETVQDIGAVVPYKGAANGPQGFGYELAVQFDEQVPEIAVLTNMGVYILRRKRFVDTLSNLIRQGGGQDGFQNDVKGLITKFGRQEVLANALAVACGQSVETTSERAHRINGPEVLEAARKIYIEEGGKPTIDQNAAASVSATIDAVRPSPRYEAAIRYVSRLVRSTWKQQIQQEKRTPSGLEIVSEVKPEKLRNVQENLTSLKKFFDSNKSFIRGLSGPDDLNRQASKDDEIALQGEHRALNSLVKFLSEMVEALSFILVLFEEKVVEIVPLLPEQSQTTFKMLTFETLVSTKAGMDVAKDLVKAIVNRNIAKGSNVETIAEALRRKCGNFCSADDVVIFKAQELLKRASEAKTNVEYQRNILNESVKLFRQVSLSLPHEYLQAAVKEYMSLQFFAGAIDLCLEVASKLDKTNDALAWMNDGKPASDPRQEKYDKRNKCYDLIHGVLEAIDMTIAHEPALVDDRPSLASDRRAEAYSLIAESKDEVFLTNIYDWYLSRRMYDRLLATDTGGGFIVTYLTRRSKQDLEHADLLWKYYSNNSQFHEAAKVQLELAQSPFELTLNKRLEYLSRARANASAYITASNTISRKTKQKLLTEINNLIDIAQIQDELLSRLRDDPRLQSGNRKEVLSKLDGPILDISTLYNQFADSAGYYDICLYIYAIADHRDASQIKNTWAQFLESEHTQAVAAYQDPAIIAASPYEVIAIQFLKVGGRLKSSESVFPVPTLIEMLERYNISQGAVIGSQAATQGGKESGMPHWVPQLFLDLEISFSLVYDTLETIYFTSNTPSATNSSQRRLILADLLFVIERWLSVSFKQGASGSGLFDGEAGQARVEEFLNWLVEQEERQVGRAEMNWARTLRGRVVEMVA